GEIVGIGGLVGAGRTEVLRGLFGIDPIAEGEIEIDGETRRIRSPRDAIAAGLSLAPEDRKLHGVILEMSIAENICMTIRERLARRALVNRNEESAIVRKQSEQLRIRAASAEAAARDLSGGNQQKVVLGKWLSLEGRVLLRDEPTRGVDVGAKEEIYHLVRELAASGK